VKTKRVNEIPLPQSKPWGSIAKVDFDAIEANEYVEIIPENGEAKIRSLASMLVKYFRTKRLPYKVCTRTLDDGLHLYVWNQRFRGAEAR